MEKQFETEYSFDNMKFIKSSNGVKFSKTRMNSKLTFIKYYQILSITVLLLIIKIIYN